MANHPNRSKPQIFVANHGGANIEVVIVRGADARAYTMNLYATFHGLSTNRQVFGGAHSCYRDTEEKTASALVARYGRGSVTFLDGRFYEKFGNRPGYTCGRLFVGCDGTVTRDAA